MTSWQGDNRNSRGKVTVCEEKLARSAPRLPTTTIDELTIEAISASISVAQAHTRSIADCDLETIDLVSLRVATAEKTGCTFADGGRVHTGGRMGTSGIVGAACDRERP